MRWRPKLPFTIQARRSKNLLSKYKNHGCKIDCVSDFHLVKEDLRYFFERLGVSEFIDDILVSSENGATKAEGSLYDIVLSACSLEATSVTVIGDNKVADIEHAKQHGLEAKWIPNFTIKKHLRIEQMKKQGSPEQRLAHSIKTFRKGSDRYAEYTVIFWVFTKRLYEELNKNGHKAVVFLSREGHFLRRCFDLYQELCVPYDKCIETKYFKCSRRAITSVRTDKRAIENFMSISIRNYFRAIGFNDSEIEKLDCAGENIDAVFENFPDSKQWTYIKDNAKLQALVKAGIEENEKVFSKYANDVFTSDAVAIVDIGWTGRMQQGIEKFLNRSLKGHYLGIYDNTPEVEQTERHGLIFHSLPEIATSQDYHILRINTILYELLTAAPHGAAQNYRFNGDEIIVSEQWDDNEKGLYEQYIKDAQTEMLYKFRELCVAGYESISDDKLTRVISHMVMRSGLLSDIRTCVFMENLNTGGSQNYGQQTKGLAFDSKEKVSFMRLLTHPVEYIRLLAKLPVKMKKSIGRTTRLYFAFTDMIGWACCSGDGKLIMEREGFVDV